MLSNYEEYYQKVYVPNHKNFWCRFFHFLGVLTTYSILIYSLLFNWLLLPLVPFIIYPFGIVGHVFEGKPPSFIGRKYRFWYAKISDLRMCWEWLTGKLDAKETDPERDNS